MSTRPLQRHAAVATILVVATVAVYWQVGGHAYVNFDDDVYVLQNPWVRDGLGWASLRWAFTTVHEAYWIPLTWLSLMLDCELFGVVAGAHLLENVGLHAADAVLLYALLVTMTGAVGRSAWVAALFALHPLHVESVAWVSQRKDVLSTLFWMLATLAYVRYVRRPSLGRHLAVALPFALGLLAKPMLVTLPVTLLLLDWWPLERHDRRWPALVAEKLPFLALAALAGAMTLWTQHGAGAVPSIGTIPIGERVATALVNVALYLGKLVWPTHLAVFYPRAPADAAFAAAAALLIAIVSASALVLARREPYLLVGWLWFLVTLLPIVGLVQVGGQQIADRYAYVPSIGVFVIVAWGAPRVLSRLAHARVDLRSVAAVTRQPDWPARVLAVAALAVVVAAAWLTHRQVSHWRDSIALFSHAVAVTERNFLAHNNLGEALAAVGRADEAAVHYAEAVRIHPGYAPARNNAGLTHARAGRYAEAEREFRAALAIHPEMAIAESNLATARARQGDYADAVAHYRRALALAPTNARAHEGLADSLALLGRLDEAIAAYREALRWAPDATSARRSLARTLRRAGRDGEAAAAEGAADGSAR